VKGEVLVLFCIPQDSAVPTADLASQVTAEVERRLGRALRPDAVHIVEDLPRTRNGKIVRRAVRAAYLRGDPGDLSSVDNPDSLRAIEGARSESAP
jgi:acetyl-CoA synthetase